jgi:elongation factor 3
MGNKIAGTKKKAKLSSSEMRKKKKERMARRKRGEEVFSDEVCYPRTLIIVT